VKFQNKHQHYPGQIFRQGNHLRRVTWVCGPFFAVKPYSYGIFAAHNRPWEPAPWTCEDLIKRGIITR